jgi:para-nitrobenzyl esterase
MNRTYFVTALLVSAASLGWLWTQSKNSDPMVASAKLAIVDTVSGKLQGFIHNGTYTYRGIPYAKAERFMPPAKVPKWEGVRTALTYGHISPQVVSNTIDDVSEFAGPHRYWLQDDDCQNLNFWTPAINDGKKRPVMVWFHGGGFSNGSSIEMAAYDGENLSKRGDVIVVTVNHRLNVVGFLDLSAYGDKYKYSDNLGIMDLVATLEWVRDNIANFGGKAAYALAEKVSMAWIKFARHGNPNHKGLPGWPAYTPANGATMIFNNTCTVRNNHDKELMSLLVPDMK